MTMPADLATVEALCELVLTARRLGCTVHIVDTPPDVRELIVLAGLQDVRLATGEEGAP